MLYRCQWKTVTFAVCFFLETNCKYTQVVLKFTKLITAAQQREAVTQGRSLPSIPATVYRDFNRFKKIT
ncbi:MAG: hypothetical protein LBL62_04790 [Planctomycetaceae bacterium]|nr:hypothetical protein [Planctomycetaceae bacterium]